MASRSTVATALLLLLGLALPAAVQAQIPDSTIPLRTIEDELNTFRSEYAENYNKKDAAAITSMYAADAVVIEMDGTVLAGKKAIGEYVTKQAPTYGHIIITSENIGGYGSTGIDVGTTTMHPPGGGEQKARYLVVLRRQKGVWHIVRLAVTPITPKS